LRTEFINGINELKKIISSKVSFKTINDINIDGRMLLSLAQSYVDSLNKGGIPTLQTAWNYMCINHSNVLKLKLIDEYKQYVNENIIKRIPMKSEELKLSHKNT